MYVLEDHSFTRPRIRSYVYYYRLKTEESINGYITWTFLRNINNFRVRSFQCARSMELWNSRLCRNRMDVRENSRREAILIIFWLIARDVNSTARCVNIKLLLFTITIETTRRVEGDYVSSWLRRDYLLLASALSERLSLLTCSWDLLTMNYKKYLDSVTMLLTEAASSLACGAWFASK